MVWEHITVDIATVVLFIVAAALLLYAIHAARINEPDLHPLILHNQVVTSNVRHPGESPLYRNVNAQLGYDLAMRPQRHAFNVAALLARSLGGQTHTARRLLDSSLSNQDVQNLAVDFVYGVRAMLSTDAPTIVVCGPLNTSVSLVALVAQSLVPGGRTLVVPPGAAPSALPAGVELVTTAVVCSGDLPAFLRGARLHICGAAAEKPRGAVEWDDVLGASSQHDPPPVPESASMSAAELDRLGAAPFATFWDGDSTWVDATQTSMTSAVTAWLSEYPAHAIPQPDDMMLTDILFESAVPAPAYVSLLLTALYTGAGFASEPAESLTSTIKILRPTLLYLSTFGAQCVEQSVWIPALSSPLYDVMKRVNMEVLRHGTFPRHRLLDRLVCGGPRARLGLDKVRATVVLGDGHAAEQTLLDALRLYLAGPVMHAYVPRRLLCEGKLSLPTGPACTSHMYDLQVFAAQPVDNDTERCLAAHVGPPSVSLEIKLVGGTPAVHKHDAAIQRVREDCPDDPIGEVYLRGYTVTSTGHDDTTISPWHATGDVALVRSNGTMVMIAPAQEDEAGMVPNTVQSFHASQQMAQRRLRRPKLGAATPAVLGMVVLCTAFTSVTARGGVELTRRADTPPPINQTMVQVAMQGLLLGQRASWEQGVAQSAVIEYEYPDWSLFRQSSPDKLYPDRNSLNWSNKPLDLLMMASQSVAGQDKQGRLSTVITGDETTNEGASMDSASCGEAVLLAAYINENFPSSNSGQLGQLGQAADRQLMYLLTNVSRSSEGAISQRAQPNVVQLWSDSGYMGPPFLGLYGLLSNNQTLLQMAYDQLRLERDALLRKTGSGTNLWQHIVQLQPRRGGGSNSQFLDPRAWLTGNAWAASGLLRVAVTIRRSPWAAAMTSQYNDLVQWCDDILQAAYTFADRGSGLMYNEVDNSTSFLDGSGSALMAYAAFRLGSLEPARRKSIDLAEQGYRTLQRSLDPVSQFTNGILTVDELRNDAPGSTSIESLAFMVLMTAARRDYYAGNVTGSNGTVAKLPSATTSKSSAAAAQPATWALAVLAAAAIGALA